MKSKTKTKQESLQTCTRCTLYITRTRVVTGRGNPQSPLWLIGEAPGFNEDRLGHAFVGHAGAVLSAALHVCRQNLPPMAPAPAPQPYLDNVIKCRPPHNRNPQISELRACTPWLWGQIHQFQPHVLVALGRFSIGMLGASDPQAYCEDPEYFKTIRVFERCEAFPWRTRQGRWLVCAPHPAYIARQPQHTPLLIRQLRLAYDLLGVSSQERP